MRGVRVKAALLSHEKMEAAVRDGLGLDRAEPFTPVIGEYFRETREKPCFWVEQEWRSGPILEDRPFQNRQGEVEGLREFRWPHLAL